MIHCHTRLIVPVQAGIPPKNMLRSDWRTGTIRVVPVEMGPMIKLGVAGLAGLLAGGLVAWYFELPASSSATIVVIAAGVIVAQAVATMVRRQRSP